MIFEPSDQNISATFLWFLIIGKMKWLGTKGHGNANSNRKFAVLPYLLLHFNWYLIRVLESVVYLTYQFTKKKKHENFNTTILYYRLRFTISHVFGFSYLSHVFFTCPRTKLLNSSSLMFEYANEKTLRSPNGLNTQTDQGCWKVLFY